MHTKRIDTDRLALRKEHLRLHLTRLHASAERLRRETEATEREWAMIGEALDLEAQRKDELLDRAARALVDLMPVPGGRR